MANVLLLHSALGLRQAVLQDAERLRDAGHFVVAPDYLDSQVFDSLDEAMAYKAGVGREALVSRVEAVANSLSGTWVFAGYSLGAGLAQHLYEQRDNAVGLFLANAGVPSPLTGAVQIHAAQNDPWIDEQTISSAATAGAEVFRYQPGGHLFSDPGLPDYDAASASLLWERVVALLRTVDEG